MFRLGRELPVRTFMNTAVAMVMATSVAFLGNAVNTLQAADVIAYRRIDGWPRLPIFLAEATGYWPTVPSLVAQAALIVVYIVGARVRLRASAPRRHAMPPPSSRRLVARRV